MSAHVCCAGVGATSNRRSDRITDRLTSAARTAPGGPRPRTLTRRALDLARWVVPGSLLVLLPKCPACLAAYFAIISGVGISVSTAAYIRLGLVTLCAASLACFAASRVGLSRKILLTAKSKR